MTSNGKLTLPKAINAYILRFPGRPITADDIVAVFKDVLDIRPNNQRRAILSHLSAYTQRGLLVRIGDGVYAAAPKDDSAEPVVIGPPSSVVEVQPAEPAPAPDTKAASNPHIDGLYGEQLDRLRGTARARALISEAVDTLDEIGSDYAYSSSRDGLKLEWNRTP